MKSLKSKKKMLELTSCYHLSWEMWFDNSWKLILHRPSMLISHTRKNKKMFNMASKYFSLFNNTPPASWAAQITRDFLIYYTCSDYVSVLSMTLFSGIAQIPPSLKVSTKLDTPSIREQIAISSKSLKVSSPHR